MNTKFEKISEFIDSLENESELNEDQAYLLISGYGAKGTTKTNNGCTNYIICTSPNENCTQHICC